MRVALVHDFLAEWGGAERVLVELHSIFPTAPVYTAFYLPQRFGEQKKYFQDWQIKTSFLQKLPFISRLYSPLRIYALLAFEQFDFTDYDVVISSSNMYMAKGIITRPETLHISYLHSIPKYLYGYTTARNWRQSFLGKVIAPYFNHQMRFDDFLANQRPDVLVANSYETKRRIEKTYHRQAEVIYPPIEVPKHFQPSPKKDYLLVVSRLVLAKHIELAIQLANRLNIPLKIVGCGPEEKRLRRLAGPKIEFLGQVDDRTLKRIYTQARVLLFPAEDEDFGIVPLEAAAHGTPVIAYRSGGSLETVKEGVSGVFFDRLSLSAILEAWHRFQQLSFNQKEMYNWASRFSKETFHQKIKHLITSLMEKNPR